MTWILPARAALITSEGFAYPDGASLNTQTGGTGWQTGFGWAGGGAATITTPSRSFPGLANSGRSVLVRAGTTQTRAFVTTGYAGLRTNGRFGLDGTELWLSFLARRETNFFVGDAGGLSLMDGNTVELYVGCPAGAANWSVQLPELGAAPGNITPAPQFPIVTGETTLLVVRMIFGVNGTQDRVELFVNPPPGVIPTLPDATRTGADLRFDRLRLQCGTSTLAAMSFDEIRLGESFTDVVPTTPNPAVAWLRSGTQQVTAGAEITLPLQYAWPAGDLTSVALAVESANTMLLPADRITVEGTGGNRRVTFRPPPGTGGTVAVNATLTQPGGSFVTASFDLSIRAAPAEGLLAYDGFAYTPVNSSLVAANGGNGGTGFAGPWLAGVDTGIPTSRFSVGTPSLPFSTLAILGGHVRVGTGGAQGARRATALPFGEDGTVRYLSVLVRPDATPAASAYFGLHLVGSAGADLFVGKPGGGNTQRYVLENAGGAGQIVTTRNVVTNEVALLVLKLEFNPGNDRISLYLNPATGSPEPVVADAVKTDLNLGTDVLPGLNGTPAWSADELRVGTTFQSVLPLEADFQLKPVSGGTVAEHTAASRKVETVDPLAVGRTLAFELVGATHNAQIDPVSGEFAWTPGELDGGQSRTFRVRATSNATPPVSLEVSFTLNVQEINQPPQLAVIPDQTQTDGQPFAFQLSGASDSDEPIQPLTYTLINGPPGMEMTPGGLLTWLPPSGLAGSFSITVRVSDNALGRAERTFTLTITARPSVFARWIATGEGNWNNPANWDISRVPSNTASEVFHVRLDVPASTIRVSESFIVGSLNWASGSRLVLEGSTGNLEVERTLSWRGGTLSGQGRLVARSRAELKGTPVNPLTIQGECQLVLMEVCELQSPLLFDGNARLLVEPTGTLNLSFDSGGLVRMSGNPELRNLGSVRIAQSPDPRPFIRVRNAGIFTDFGSTLNFPNGAATDLVQEPTGKLNLGPDSRIEGTVVLDTGSTLTGSGYLRDARINGTVKGRFSFNQLTLGSTALLHFGSGDRLTAQLPVVLAGRLELVLIWPAQPGPNDVFDLIRSTGGISGAFISPSLGQRLRLPGGTGTTLLERTDNSLAVVLRNYQGPSVSLDDAPLTIVLPESPGNPARGFALPHAAVSLPEGDWAGGMVSAKITEGFIATVDRLEFLPNPGFATSDAVSFVGPANGDQAVHFRTRRIGTARITENEMVCSLTPAADREAVVALLGHLHYANKELTPDWYTKAESRYPKRVLTTRLTDNLGKVTEIVREIGFPFLTGLKFDQDYRELNSFGTTLLHLVGIFSTGQRMPVRQLIADWSEDCPSIILSDSATGFPGQKQVVGGFDNPDCCMVFVRAGGFVAMARYYRADRSGAVPSILLREFEEWLDEDIEAICPIAAAWRLNVVIPSCGTPGRGASVQGDAGSSIGSPTSYHTLESLMKETPPGRRWVALYRQHSPEVVRLFLADPRLFLQAQELLTTWHPGVAALLSGKGDTCVITPLMITQLDAFWTALAAQASPALKAFLEEERRRFDEFHRFEGVSFAEWAGILGIPIPTQPRLHISLMKRDGDRFLLALNEVAGVPVTLWRSTDLKIWTPVPNAVIERDGGSIVITDPTAPSSEAFYEVRP